MGGKDDRIQEQRKAASKLGKFHLSFTVRKGLGREREGQGGKRDRKGRLSG